MTCRACGATIAVKAIVCYRCGAAIETPTMPARFGAPRSRRTWLLVLAAIALIAAAVVWWILQEPQ